MSTQLEFQPIEPEFLAELAERAVQEEKRLKNPYLRALMTRLGLLARELKSALEKEGRLNGNRAHSAHVTKGPECE